MQNASSDGKTKVLEATDIVQLIGQSVKLVRRGKDYLGLCPFHQEKSPSFSVKPDRQFFYCFGCKASGNAIDYVMKRDRIEFREALELLARQANIDLPSFGIKKQNVGERQMLLDAHSVACSLFEKWLAHETIGKAARDYLLGRGFTPEWLKKFQVGFVPDGWDNLARSPEMKRFSPQQLSLAGLVKTRDESRGGGWYDTFRNRIMFPIRDESGRIIAFGGRIMPSAPPADGSPAAPPRTEAKYLNSPETPLFSKGRCAYGIDLARQRIVETRTVAIVEGYTDVMMAHQFGASNVVSILGTAMTESHVNLLRRFADKIVLLFDADAAGDTATQRAMELFLTQPIEIGIASMPEGIDPDEFLLAHGADGFAALLNDAQDALTYKWKQVSKDFNAAGGDLTRQQKVVSEYLELLADARGTGPVDSIRWGQVLTRVSRLTGIAVDELNRRFKAKPTVRKSSPQSQSQAVSTGLTSDKVSPQGVDENRPNTGDRPQGDYPLESDAELSELSSRRPLSAQDRAERWILGILLAQPSRWHDVQKHVAVEDFASEICRRIARVYWDHQRDEGEPVLNEFLSTLKSDAQKVFAIELVNEIDRLTEVDQLLADALAHFDKAKQRREEQELRRGTESHLSEEEQIARLRRLQNLASKPDPGRRS